LDEEVGMERIPGAGAKLPRTWFAGDGGVCRPVLVDRDARAGASGMGLCAEPPSRPLAAPRAVEREEDAG
jgi:hypothetical protein